MTETDTLDEAGRLRLVLPDLPDDAAQPIHGHGEPWQLCIRCMPSDDGPDPGCRVCEGSGVLDAAGDPFFAPAPFDTWTPEKLVELAASSRARAAVGEYAPTPAPVGQPAKLPRMTQRHLIEKLLAILGRTQTKHSSATITRGQRGTVGWELTVSTGEQGVETLTQAVDAAIVEHNRLAALFPQTEEPTQ